MAMINVSASLPSPMWALVRLLASTSRPVPVEQARALLCPPPLLSAEQWEKDETFDNGLRTLRELNLVALNDDQVSLTEQAAALSGTDLYAYTDVLRRTVLDRQRNGGLGADNAQTGPRDLVRALAWFLTQDPLGPPLDWAEVAQIQHGAFPEHVGNPFVNDVRWLWFSNWAPALGFAAAPLLSGGGGGGQKLMADCTHAVKRTMLTRWRKSERIDAVEAVGRIYDDLPVLPGGAYSLELGLPAQANKPAPTLSFALLCGHDQGWLALDYRSDAPRQVLIVDPDAASGTRRVSDITILGAIDG